MAFHQYLGLRYPVAQAIGRQCQDSRLARVYCLKKNSKMPFIMVNAILTHCGRKDKYAIIHNQYLIDYRFVGQDDEWVSLYSYFIWLDNLRLRPDMTVRASSCRCHPELHPLVPVSC